MKEGMVEKSVFADMFHTGGQISKESFDQMFEVGQEFLSRYKVLRLLGSGGNGQVLLCHDDLREKEVALKLLKRVDWESNRRNLQQEIEVQEGLRHDCLASVFDVGLLPDKNTPFYTMEYVEGDTLEEVLQKRGNLSFSECVVVFEQVVDALDYLHKKDVIHLDLKPSNLMVSPEQRIKLLDFGLATAVGNEHDSSGEGSAYFMAPEQLHSEMVTKAADQFSLGVILYFCLTGKIPVGRFVGPYQHLVENGDTPDFSEALDDVVMRSLEHDAENRFPSVREFWMAVLFSAQMKARHEEAVKDRPQKEEQEYLEFNTKRSCYKLEGEVLEGEISNICFGSEQDTGQKIVIKIVDSIEDNDLMLDEIRCLRLLQSYDAPQTKHIPELVEEVKTETGNCGLVLKHFDGVDLEVIRQSYPQGLPQEHVVWILSRCLSAIGFAHKKGVIHGNIEPTHILVRAQDHNIMLIDWSYSLIRPMDSGALFKCYNELFSAPEVREQKPPIPGSDLYSLGKCMIYLLGGDLDTNELPTAVDDRLRRFLHFLTNPSPLQRPRDAWEMHSRLATLRKQIFGKHEFQTFSCKTN